MKYLLSLAGILIALDQISKFLIVEFVPLFSNITVVPGFFDIVHVRNTGAAFSLFAGSGAAWRQPLFVSLTLLVVGILVFAYRKLTAEDTWTKTAYACIIGGALGNLIDRVRFGEVIDFLDFYISSYHWPAFNVADTSITVGAVMLMISLLRGK